MAKQETPTALMRDTELQALVKKGTREITEVEAFKELARRRVKALPQLSGKIIADPKCQLDLRTAAAIALGKCGGRAPQRALIKALASHEAAIVSNSAASLGRIGDQDALATLEKKRVSANHPAARSIDFARCLITYRFGLAKHILSPARANRQLKVNGRKAMTLETKRVSPAAVKKEIEQLRDRRLGFPISDKGAVKFTCNECEYWAVFNADFADPAFLRELKSHSAIAAAVVKLDRCGGVRYVDEFLVVNPLKSSRGDLIGVRPSGIVVHSGHFSLDGNKIKFSLRSANTTHSAAIDLNGSYAPATAKVTLDKARVLDGPATGQKPSRAPKADT